MTCTPSSVSLLRMLDDDPESVLEPGESWVEIYGGALHLIQHRSGYRFSLEALLLAYAARHERGHLLEIGTGSGIVAASLALLAQPASVTAVEIQAAFARRARLALARAGLEVELVHADVRTWSREHPRRFDAVISNPPYFRVGAGALAPDSERAAARHEIHLDLQALIAAVGRVLKPRGSFYLTYPANRLSELLCAMHTAGIEPRVLRMVHNAPGQPAQTALIQGIVGAKPDLQVEPPLYVRRSSEHTGNAHSAYSDEVQDVLSGGW